MAADPLRGNLVLRARLVNLAATAGSAWQSLLSRRLLALAALMVAVAVLFVIDLGTGPARLAPAEVLLALAGSAPDPTTAAIVWSIRLPMAVLGLLVGAALGLSGAVVQTVLANPLASPYTLGIAGAAGFGAAVAIVFDLPLPLPLSGELRTVLFAFLTAVLAVALLLALSGLRGGRPETIVLAGLAILFLFQALLALVQYLATPEALAQIVFWLFGSLARADWGKIVFLAASLSVALPALMRLSWRLSALALGEERAAALGARPGALRLEALAWVSLLTAVAVAFAGTIGFVGLVAPHLARTLVGEDHRFLLPSAALAGSLLLLAASIAARALVPGSLLPIGILTALVGVPFLLGLVVRRSLGRTG